MRTATSLDGRRARRLENRIRILDAALELAAERTDVTVEEIAERAGVSERSMYNHFPSFRDLIAGMYERGAEKLRPLFAYLPSPDDRFEDRVRQWVAVWARIQEEIAPIRWRALISESEHPSLQPELFELRARHRSEIERIFPEIKCETSRRAAVAMTDSLGWRALRRHQGLSFEEACEVVEESIRRLAE